jgi:hypothetical protein
VDEHCDDANHAEPLLADLNGAMAWKANRRRDAEGLIIQRTLIDYHWHDRMDRHFDDQGVNDSGLTTRLSELLKRNCWISFEPVEGSLYVLADYIGPHKIMWATDYPHQDGFSPGAPQMIRDRLEPFSPEARHQVLAGGAFYGLN